MDLDIYRILDVTNVNDDNSHNLCLTYDTLTKIIKNLSNLHSEINLIEERCRVTSRESIKEFFYFDFDVLYSAINWLSAREQQEGFQRQESFWSSLSVMLHDHDVFLLPGSLFEILRFLKRRQNIENQLSKSAMTSAFIEGFFSTSASRSDISPFISSIGALQNISFNEKTFFILRQLFGSIHHTAEFASKFQYETEQFQELYYLLSAGTRRSKQINNRVDALNLATLSQMNSTLKKEHHCLISNSSALGNLFGATSNAAELMPHGIGNPVVSPRYASLYRLINTSTNSAADAEQFSNQLGSNVQELISTCKKLRRKVEGGAEVLRNDVVHSDAVVDLVWMLEGAREEIKERRKSQEKSFELFRRKYTQEDQKDFLIDVQEKIRNSLDESIYKNYSRSRSEMNELTIEKFFSDATTNSETFATEAFEIFNGTHAVNILVENGALRLWMPANLTFLDFIHSIASLNSRVMDKFFSDEYSFSQLSPPNDEFFEGGSLIILTETDEFSFEINLTDGNLPSKVVNSIGEEIDPNDIVFVRFSHDLYSSTYDGQILAARTSYDVVKDINHFFDRALHSKTNILRNRMTRHAIDEYASNAYLRSVSP